MVSTPQDESLGCHESHRDAGAAAYLSKIEFSHRGLDDDEPLGAVDTEVIRRYRLYPVMLQHDSTHTAFAQRVSALALREPIQSRDVFDLKLLLDAGGGRKALPTPTAAYLAAAIDNAMAVNYGAFAGQLVADLEAEYQDHYGSRQPWREIQEQVVRGLDDLRP